MLLIITSTGDRLFKFINIDDLEPWLQKSELERVNYNEMDGDRQRLPANRNCYRISCVS